MYSVNRFPIDPDIPKSRPINIPQRKIYKTHYSYESIPPEGQSLREFLLRKKCNIKIEYSLPSIPEEKAL